MRRCHRARARHRKGDWAAGRGDAPTRRRRLAIHGNARPAARRLAAPRYRHRRTAARDGERRERGGFLLSQHSPCAIEPMTCRPLRRAAGARISHELQVVAAASAHRRDLLPNRLAVTARAPDDIVGILEALCRQGERYSRPVTDRRSSVARDGLSFIRAMAANGPVWAARPIDSIIFRRRLR